MRELPAILAWARTTAWAIDPAFGRRAYTALIRRALGKRLDADEIDEALRVPRANVAAHEKRAAEAKQSTGGAVAVIPILGMIRHRGGNAIDDSGNRYAGLQGLTQALREADADPNVKAIVLDIDSPGGAVDGIDEAGAVIASLSTPVIGVANTLAASAAYWLLSQVDLAYVTPSGEVGSIGVYTMHVDESEYLAQEGLSVSLISAGEFKVEGNPFGPLEPAARDRAQVVIDDIYERFLKTVARGRGVSVKTVRDTYGKGRVLIAREALDAGMVDRIGTLDEAIARAARGRISKRRARASAAGAPSASEVRAAEDAVEPAAEDAPKQGPILSADTERELLELEFLSLGSRD